MWTAILGSLSAAKSNLILVAAVIGAASFSFLGWHFGNLHGQRMATKEVQAQVELCKKNDAITEGVANDLQDKLDAVSIEHDGFDSVRDCPASLPVARATCQHDAGTVAGKPAKANGATIGAFLDYAAEAERYRLQLVSCQSFIRQERGQQP